MSIRKLAIGSSAMATWVVVLGVLALPALATAPEVSAVTVESIAATGVTFNDVLNPAASFPVEPGTYQYLYKKAKTAGCEGESKAPVPPGMYFGAAPESYPEPVTGLAPDAYYTVCLRAENTAKEATTSTPVTFETAPETPTTPTVSPITATTATLHGVLNPNSTGEAGTYEFLYQESASECASGTATTQEEATGAEKQPAKEVELTGLTPGAQYTACLSVTNGASETTIGPPVTFRALSEPPTILPETTSVTEVTSTSARLGAEIDPDGGATTYHFEYDTTPYIGSAPHGQSTPESTSIGSDNNKHPAGATIEHLQPGTEYHYRVVASNASAQGGVDGPDQTFTTQPAGSEFSLPDNRAWEQVSPADKYGARIEAITHEGGMIQAAAEGSAITYVAEAPVVTEPDGNPSRNMSQVVSVRGAGSGGGWGSRDIAIPHTEAFGVKAGRLDEYVAFSPSLESAIVEPFDAPELAPQYAEKGIGSTPYVRENLLEPASNTYNAIKNNENVTSHATYDNTNYPYVAASNDLKHVIIDSYPVPLTTSYSTAGYYEWNANKPASEQLQPVSVLPDNELVWSGINIGANSLDVRNAVSENGDLVFWEYHNDLYLRDVPAARTVQLDLPQEGTVAGGEHGAEFTYATPDGEQVYFTDSQRLTADATAELERPELYEYNTSTGKLRDLTPDKLAATSINVEGEVIGATGPTPEGEYIYFVATGKLTANAIEGENNLYMEHITGSTITPTLITVLSGGDLHDWEGIPGREDESLLTRMTSRMSPNGLFVAFMSERSLTGYDNTDAVSNEKDEEVFEYDAISNRVVCVSCNPTGARPHGVLQGRAETSGTLLVDLPGTWENRWLAGNVPGYTAQGEDNSDYQSRYLSDSGRLFFNSSDALVPQDTNGKMDVYEFEPEGVGTCVAGGALFDRVLGGCDALVSSGKSSEESAFLDASESGDDVFFLTSQPLSLSDIDNADDVYDAHVCSSDSPCASTASVVPPPCTTADSCKAALAVQPAIFGASGSATFSGAGNLAAPVVKPTVRVWTRAQKLAAALRLCRRKPKRKRAACEASARKRYRSPSKSKRSSRKGGK